MKHTPRVPGPLSCALLLLSTCLTGCDDPTEPRVIGQLTRLAGQGEHPDISGSRVVWRDTDPVAGGHALRVRDLSTGDDSVVVSFDADDVLLSFPRIAGDRIAWVEGNTATDAGHVVVLDLTTGEEATFPAVPGSTFPALSEEGVAWVDRTGDSPALVAHEFATGVRHSLAAGGARPRSSDIAAGTVVWTDVRNQQLGRPDVFVSSLSAPEERLLAGGSSPSISDGRVVYRTETGLRLFDLDRQTERELPARERSQVLPDIDGGHVVWMETGPGTRDIILLNLPTGNVVQLSTEGAGLAPPRISGDRVVWQAEGGGILLFTIDP